MACSNATSTGCSLADLVITTSSCNSNAHIAVEIAWVSPKSCVGGVSLPPSRSVACDHLPIDSIAGYVVLGIAGLSGCGLLVYLLWIVLRTVRKDPIALKTQPLVSIIFLASAVVLATVAPVAALGPNDDLHCRIRPWAWHVPFTTMFAALFMKVRKLFRFVDNKSLRDASTLRTRPAFQLLQVFGFVMIDVVVLVIWTLVPGVNPESKHVEEDTGDGIRVIRTVCRSPDFLPTGLLIVYKIALVAYGTFLCLHTRRVDSRFVESKHILVVNLMVALTAAAFTPLWYALGNDAKTTMWRLVLCLGASSLGALGAGSILYMPKMMFSTSRAVGPIDDLFDQGKSQRRPDRPSFISHNTVVAVKDIAKENFQSFLHRRPTARREGSLKKTQMEVDDLGGGARSRRGTWCGGNKERRSSRDSNDIKQMFEGKIEEYQNELAELKEELTELRERLMESRYTNTELKDKLDQKEEMLQALVSCSDHGAGVVPKGGQGASLDRAASERREPGGRRNSLVGRVMTLGRRCSTTFGMCTAPPRPTSGGRAGPANPARRSAPDESGAAGTKAKPRRRSGEQIGARLQSNEPQVPKAPRRHSEETPATNKANQVAPERRSNRFSAQW